MTSGSLSVIPRREGPRINENTLHEPSLDAIANGVDREGDDLPDKLNRGGRRRELDGSLASRPSPRRF